MRPVSALVTFSFGPQHEVGGLSGSLHSNAQDLFMFGFTNVGVSWDTVQWRKGKGSRVSCHFSSGFCGECDGRSVTYTMNASPAVKSAWKCDLTWKKLCEYIIFWLKCVVIAALPFSGMFNPRDNAGEGGQIFMKKEGGGERHLFKAFWTAEFALINLIRLSKDAVPSMLTQSVVFPRVNQIAKSDFSSHVVFWPIHVKCPRNATKCN